MAKKKKLLFIFLTFLGVFGGVFCLLELVLRIIPIPGIQFNCLTYDPVVGIRIHPHSTWTYRDNRGRFVERKANSWGYLDAEHVKAKPINTFRIGFFGDSYTEAVQVPLEDTFFRQVELNLNDQNVECFSIGHGSFSTLQSYLSWQRWGTFFDMDLVVYVFFENDLGDQIKTIHHIPCFPFAELTADGGFKIDNSFRRTNRFYQRLWYRIPDYLTAHSLVCATLSQRISLLRQCGVKPVLTEADRLTRLEEKQRWQSGKEIAKITRPSLWPKDLRDYAEKLGAAVILKWRDETVAQSQKFAVLYVPRSDQLAIADDRQDSWKPWLIELCRQNHITFIDPTPLLLAAQSAGQEIYYDHFTKIGHTAFAQAFIAWFKQHPPADNNQTRKDFYVSQ